MYESKDKKNQSKTQHHFILNKKDLSCVHCFSHDNKQPKHLNEFNYPFENTYNDILDKFLIAKGNKIHFVNSFSHQKLIIPSIEFE